MALRPVRRSLGEGGAVRFEAARCGERALHSAFLNQFGYWTFRAVPGVAFGEVGLDIGYSFLSLQVPNPPISEGWIVSRFRM
jgi:hypothetical protein